MHLWQKYIAYICNNTYKQQISRQKTTIRRFRQAKQNLEEKKEEIVIALVINDIFTIKQKLLTESRRAAIARTNEKIWKLGAIKTRVKQQQIRGQAIKLVYINTL